MNRTHVSSVELLRDPGPLKDAQPTEPQSRGIPTGITYLPATNSNLKYEGPCAVAAIESDRKKKALLGTETSLLLFQVLSDPEPHQVVAEAAHQSGDQPAKKST